MAKLFTTVPVPRFPSSTFSLSRPVMFTARPQKLYVPNIIEILPGDGINESQECFARAQPMVTPTFAKMNMSQEAFFVPCWQLSKHFDDFITGGERGDFTDKLPYTTVSTCHSLVYDMLYAYTQTAVQNARPYQMYNADLERIQDIIECLDMSRAVPMKLPDFVLATNTTYATSATANLNAFQTLNSGLTNSPLRVNLLPFAAMLKVWSEYYRDENLCDDLYELCWTGVSLDEATGYVDLYSVYGNPSTLPNIVKYHALFGVKNRAWAKDYFTSALPFTQRGPEVVLPLSGTFPVDFTGPGVPVGSSSFGVEWNSDTPATDGAGKLYGSAVIQDSNRISGSVTIGASAQGSTIQDLRRAFRLEEFYEADARGGNRYPENTLMQFGVRTPDSRLPRAMFCGQTSTPVQISEVLQTSQTTSTSPQGNLAGRGISYGQDKLCRQFFTMHGFVLNFFTIRTKAIYEQGIHPMFSRFDRTEYAWPRFANLGEQPIYDKQLFVDTQTTEDSVFGYTPRYAEYKSENGSIHGLLKSSLNFWTMSRRFNTKPVLSEDFIYNSPRLDNFQVVNPLQPPFIVEIDFRVRANRKLPYFGVPML